MRWKPVFAVGAAVVLTIMTGCSALMDAAQEAASLAPTVTVEATEIIETVESAEIIEAPSESTNADALTATLDTEGSVGELYFRYDSDWTVLPADGDTYLATQYVWELTPDERDVLAVMTFPMDNAALEDLLSHPESERQEMAMQLLDALTGSFSDRVEAPMDSLPPGIITGWYYDGLYDDLQARGALMIGYDYVYNVMYLADDREASPFAGIWGELLANMAVGSLERLENTIEAPEFASVEPAESSAALAEAQSLIDETGGFSEWGLRLSLSLDYTENEIQYAIENLNVDWVEQARIAAQSYLAIGDFTKAQMIGMLENEGFEEEQIQPVVTEIYG